MPLVLIGVLLVLAKLAGFGVFDAWPWWAVLAPFGGAVLWWSFADSSGLTQRRAMDQMERKRAARRARTLAALGIDNHRDQRAQRQRDAASKRAAAERGRADAADKPPR